jgi:SEC-C motif-containing protein
VSSEPLTRNDLDPPVEGDDPLAELSDPYDLDDGYEESGDYDDPDQELDELALDDDDDDPEELTNLALRDSEPVLLIWPRDEYEEVDQRWPEVLEPIGTDSWDGYRRYYQALMTRWAKRGLPPLLQVTGSAEGFADYLAEQGADPMGADFVAMADAYGHQLADQAGGVELPPARTDSCWCGSEISYAECCLPLSPG